MHSIDPSANGAMPNLDASGMQNYRLGGDGKHKLTAGVRNILIEHPAFASGIRAIRDCHSLGLFQIEEPGRLLIMGVSGSGKSTLRKEYARLHPRRDTETGTEIPVLHLELPAQPTIKNVAERILLELGDPLFNRGSAEVMTARIVTLLRNCHVELVILDEFQHFIDRSSEKVETKVADWLKYLINTTKIPFVLIGLRRCSRILQSNEQLRRRFCRQIVLEPFPIRNKQELRIFEGLIHSLLDSLPVPPSDEFIKNRDIIERVHFATYGVMGYIMTLMSAAVQLALDDGLTCINVKLLERAFCVAVWPNGRGSLNPFDSRFIKRPLTEREEPFFGY
ncbi:TniB family NTP-binding protein [Paraburkholderia aspalathi]|uniref:TniB family NTP-binding protein n=1 Tax=Paraburkholderia aspalathi TaxID=1324617 RepID=UPI001F3816E8|nr:TniB family NTP-binding protein [Paraburkholderia aspalathi]